MGEENKENLEFGLESIKLLENNLAKVIGRCFQGPISVGCKFKFCYKSLPQRAGTGYAPSLQSAYRSVLFEVKGIVAYEQELTAIDTGLTAELTLVGNEVGRLRQGDVLSSENCEFYNTFLKMTIDGGA